MAFRPTLVKLAEGRKDVHPALVKQWGKYWPEEGQVTRHLSPYEQDIIKPMLKSAPEKLTRRLTKFGPWWLFCAGSVYGTVAFGNWYYDQLAREHRS